MGEEKTHQFALVAGCRFAEDVLEMGAQSTDADSKCIGDILGAFLIKQILQNAGFGWRQSVESGKLVQTVACAVIRAGNQH